MRVLSLHPGVTDLLCRIDAADCLVDSDPDLVVTREDGVPGALVLSGMTLDAILDDLLSVGPILGLEGAVGAEIARLRERLWRAQEHVNPYVDGPRVAFVQSATPLAVAGDWIPQMIERAGGRHPLNPTSAPIEAGAAAGFQQAWRTAGSARPVEPHDLRDLDCLIVSVPGGDEADARALLESLSDRPQRVAALPGGDFHVPGPRLVDGFEWLVGWLNDRPALSQGG